MLTFLASDFIRASMLTGQIYARVQHGIMPSLDAWGAIAVELGILERSCTPLKLTSTLARISRLKQKLDRTKGNTDITLFTHDLAEIQVALIDELSCAYDLRYQ